MILAKLWAAIASLFTKKTTMVAAAPVEAGAAASTITTTEVETPAEVADTDLTAAITIVNNLKNALASPLAVLITDLIPGTIDDTIREELVTDLPVLAADLANVQVAITADKSAQLSNVLAAIKASPNFVYDAFFHSLAATLLTRISQGKNITWSVAVMSVEYFFKNLFSAAPVAEAVAPVVTDAGNTTSAVVNTAAAAVGAAGAIAAAAGASPGVQKDIATASNILGDIENAVNQ